MKKHGWILIALAVILALVPVFALAEEAEVRYSTDGGSTWTTGKLEAAVYAGYNSDITIELLRNITLTSNVNWWEGAVIGNENFHFVLNGKGFTITRDRSIGKMFSVNVSGSTVTFQNVTLDGGAVWSSSDPLTRTNSGASYTSNAHLVEVGDGARLILADGAILQNSDITSSQNGGAVNILYGGTVVMKNNAIIRNNRAAEAGYYGGSGGGVAVNYGSTFTMEGGTITGNYATTGGGGVTNSGVFEMLGGKIVENATGNNGGGVTNEAGTFDMSGGSIENNRTAAGGGAVTIFGGTVQMSGGSITGNSATGTLGGGVLVYGGSMQLSGKPVVMGNTDSNGNSNVYLPSGKTVSIGALSDGAQIGVLSKSKPSAENPLLSVSGSANEDYTRYFKSDDTHCEIRLGSDGAVQLGIRAVTYPSKPQNVQAAAADGSVTVTWKAPADDGASDIVRYEVSSDGGATWTAVDASSMSHAFAALAGQTYDIQVRAANSQYTSEAASVRISLPAAPVSATPPSTGDTSALLLWAVLMLASGAAIILLRRRRAA